MAIEMIDFDKMEQEQEQKTEQEPKKAAALTNMTDNATSTRAATQSG